jgi:glycosyltransferase involved in cell wall biosynthesis
MTAMGVWRLAIGRWRAPTADRPATCPAGTRDLQPRSGPSTAKRPRVGIDAHALGSGLGGNETYIRNVIRALVTVDPDGAYTLFLSPPPPQGPIAGAERMGRVMVRPHTPLVRIPVSFPLALARERIDVVHVQYVAPPLCPARIVVSVHDLAYEHYPQFFSRAEVARFRALVPWTIRRAAAVLTLSEFSRQDIVRRYGVPPEKVVVAPCAADPMFRPLHDEARLADVRARYGTGERFILCVGNLQPRKNLRTLIDAYVRLRRADATRHKLVLVGRKAWLYDDIFAVARASGYAGELVFTGYVPDEDLVALDNAADLFVYPSLFEGFGLPPLEAMACGTPVVTAQGSSFPEVVGDAALTVDPLDAEALAGAIATMLRDAGLRARFSARGLQRAATFSWEASARAIAAIYAAACRP